MIKSLDKGMTVLCRSWYQCYLSLFHSPSPSVVFLLLISLHQNARNKKGERKKLPHGLFMGPADKMLTWKLRRIYGAAWSFCGNCSLAFLGLSAAGWNPCAAYSSFSVRGRTIGTVLTLSPPRSLVSDEHYLFIFLFPPLPLWHI